MNCRSFFRLSLLSLFLCSLHHPSLNDEVEEGISIFLAANWIALSGVVLPIKGSFSLLRNLKSISLIF